jgi:hypothetical protein
MKKIYGTLLAILLMVVPVFATTRLVSTVGSDAGNCSLAACKTVGYALNQAAIGDTISIAAGTYKEHDLQINKTLTIVGAGIGNTAINGNFAGRVFSCSATASISDLSIQYGNVAGPGGGLYNTGHLSLVRVMISSNKATGANGNGAGIYNTGNIAIQGSFILVNQADQSGGGIYNTSPSALLSIQNSMIGGNFAQFGGGILNYNGATLGMSTSRVTRNRVTVEGGGIDNNSATAVFDNVTIAANQAESAGGGMKNDNSANSTFTNVTFIGNTTTLGQGGGLLNNNSSFATGTDVTFSDNYADVGGGVYNIGATLVLTDATFSANTGGAGALYTDTNGSTTLTNTTISGNFGISGIEHNVSTTTLKNTIVANNAGNDCEGGVPITSLGHNLDGSNTCGFDPALKDQTGIDPMLLQLANNGKKGYTQTLALQKGSPAIDKGNNSGCPASDQRGLKRPIDGDAKGSAVCDIGSYEFKP